MNSAQINLSYQTKYLRSLLAQFTLNQDIDRLIMMYSALASYKLGSTLIRFIEILS